MRQQHDAWTGSTLPKKDDFFKFRISVLKTKHKKAPHNPLIWGVQESVVFRATKRLCCIKGKFCVRRRFRSTVWHPRQRRIEEDLVYAHHWQCYTKNTQFQIIKVLLLFIFFNFRTVTDEPADRCHMRLQQHQRSPLVVRPPLIRTVEICTDSQSAQINI